MRITPNLATMHVHAFGSREELFRPCVDCGRKTGNYCETPIQVGHAEAQGGKCFAKDRVPSEHWAIGQKTPLCTFCENIHGSCHFCRGVESCTPFPWDPKDKDPGEPTEKEDISDTDL